MKVKEDQPLAAESAKAIDSALREALHGETALPCAVAFEIAARLGAQPAGIGAAADRLNIRLTKCQLGLFGYTPAKKIVEPAAVVEPEFEQAIRSKLTGGRLACRDAWDLAQAFRRPKLAVSAACEALGVKIKPCQLGAF
jgi:hypothetical protein